MVISDKEAFRLLGLPLGVDRDAIQERYKQLSCKLSSSKLPEDRKKLEQIITAFCQLMPQSYLHSTQNNPVNSNKKRISKSNAKNNQEDNKSHILEEDSIEESQKTTTKKKSKKKKTKLNSPDSDENKSNTNISNQGVGRIEREENFEVQGIDPNCAFVAKVGKKIGNKGSQNSSSNGSNSAESDKQNVLMEARQVKSRQLAMRGNEEANNGEYKRAVHLFTEAIRLDPNDHRFFGNRSYCFAQLHQFIEALKDADKAIHLAPQWPKGYFRRGRALKGLGKLLESEESFKQVLRYDPGCEDAIQEINKVRRRRLVDMGFTDLQAKAAIKKYSQVQPALDALLAGEFQINLENVYFSDDEDDEDVENTEEEREEVSWQTQTKLKDEKMNPRNVQGHTSLWVGNVVPEVTEKMLIKLFSKYGQVTSVRQLKDKYCAFVNYTDKKWAGAAMENLQGYDFGGSKLLIKFPDNPIVNGSQNIVIRKNKNSCHK